ncbi:MAG TPA: HD domain-containing protein [Thermoanaerobaculia bacterium]|nr:HD domain-containing protein [Thermoanaerobaculia bacterium]
MAELSVRDPVHGFIRADALESELVGARPLQRLRSIRQLGLTHLIFPGAEHSRFSHALGAMHLAGRLYDALAAKADGLLEGGARAPARRALRAAALLHDVGHAPFSHTAESLFDRPIDHEGMTRLLLGLPEVTAAFARHELDRELVLDLLAGEVEGPLRLLAQAISGELDVDKMDYLLRDSLFCGVQYGRFDLDRVLDTVTPIQDPDTGRWGIGVEQGGVHALEALVLARYYMFTQVYFNVTGKVLELHLNQWLEESGVRWSSDPERFLEQDDVTVEWRMRASGSVHARAVLDRAHYQLAAETGEHPSEEEKRCFEELLGPLRERYGPGRLLVSRSAKDPHRLGRSRVLVRGPNDRLQPMEEASHFIKHLSRIDTTRVYTHPGIRDEVARELAGS